MTGPTCTHGIWAAFVLAILWSAGLLVGATTIPIYGSSAETVNDGGSRTVTHTSNTLVEVNGSGILLILALPLAASVAAGIALLRPRVGRIALGMAWTMTGLVGLLSLVAMLSVGLAIMPVAWLLATACGLGLKRSAALGSCA